MSDKREVSLSRPLPTSVEIERQVLASLPQSIARGLQERVIDRSTKEYGYDYELVGYIVPDCSPEDRAEARLIVERSLTACSGTIAEKALAELRVSTKSRPETDDDLALMVDTYLRLLLEYPEDAVLGALRYWARNEKFWPALAELKVELDQRVRKRRLLLTAL